MTDAPEQTAFHLIFFSLKNFALLFVEIESVVRNGTPIQLILKLFGSLRYFPFTGNIPLKKMRRFIPETRRPWQRNDSE